MAAHAETLSHDSHDGKKHHGVGFYVGIWVVLLCFTVLTYAAAHVDMGEWNLTIALAIAVTKGTIVCLFFMHLWGDTRANQFVLILSLLFLILMCSMTLADVNTRFPLLAPPNSQRFMVSPRGQLE